MNQELKEKMSRTHDHAKGILKAEELEERERETQRLQQEAQDLLKKATEKEQKVNEIVDQRVQEKLDDFLEDERKKLEGQQAAIEARERALVQERQGEQIVNLQLPVNNSMLQAAVDSTVRPVYEAMAALISGNGGLTPGNYLAVQLFAETMQKQYRQKLGVD